MIPQRYKGIALFTPGGDLVYCIDPTKQGRWHSHLCHALQSALQLPELPHFLIPGYTATVDRWYDAQQQSLKTVAECYPAVKRYQPLLNAAFGTPNLIWQTAPWQEEVCHPIVLETYRQQFPQLWDNHDLIIRLDTTEIKPETERLSHLFDSSVVPWQSPQSYVLRLFVSGNSAITKRTLEMIHQLLEQELQYPYTLKVIDIAKNPEMAESHHVSATPTLVRVYPQPMRRIVGEIENMSHVLPLITVWAVSSLEKSSANRRVEDSRR